MILRFYILQCHYRSPLDFTDEAMQAAKSGFDRMKNSIVSLKKITENKSVKMTKTFEDVEIVKKEFLSAMDDDFNTPVAISVIYDILKISNTESLKTDPDFEKLVYIKNAVEDFTEKVLGFKFNDDKSDLSIEDKLIKKFIDLRATYKAEKNFTLADKVRDDLKDIGITLKDGPAGTTYSK